MNSDVWVWTPAGEANVDGSGNRRPRARAGAGAMAICVGAFMLVVSFTPASGPDGAVAAESPFAPFVDLQGTRLSGADDAGRRLWELQAQSLQLDRDRNLVVLVGVDGWLFRNGKQQVHVVAPRATYASKANTVELAGGVRGTAVDGRQFAADTVRWVGGGHLSAGGGIVLTQPGLIIRAERMQADAALEQVTFEGHVAITVVP